jgi:hypothetical protein
MRAVVLVHIVLHILSSVASDVGRVLSRRTYDCGKAGYKYDRRIVSSQVHSIPASNNAKLSQFFQDSHPQWRPESAFGLCHLPIDDGRLFPLQDEAASTSNRDGGRGFDDKGPELSGQVRQRDST